MDHAIRLLLYDPFITISAAIPLGVALMGYRGSRIVPGSRGAQMMREGRGKTPFLVSILQKIASLGILYGMVIFGCAAVVLRAFMRSMKNRASMDVVSDMFHFVCYDPLVTTAVAIPIIVAALGYNDSKYRNGRRRGEMMRNGQGETPFFLPILKWIRSLGILYGMVILGLGAVILRAILMNNIPAFLTGAFQ